LFYSHNDYEGAVIKFFKSAKVKNTGIEEYKDELIILTQESKRYITEEPSSYDFRYFDNKLVNWIEETYREYGDALYGQSVNQQCNTLEQQRIHPIYRYRNL